MDKSVMAYSGDAAAVHRDDVTVPADDMAAGGTGSADPAIRGTGAEALSGDTPTVHTGTPERVYVLSFREVLLLLQGAGVKAVDGIYMEEPQIPDEQVILLIDGLVKKGILTSDGEAFRMEKTAARMIRCMGYPERHYRAREGDREIYCYERGEDLLVTRLCPVRERTMELVLRKKEEILI